MFRRRGLSDAREFRQRQNVYGQEAATKSNALFATERSGLFVFFSQRQQSNKRPAG